MKIDFSKENGLVPAIIQDATTKNVLMLGYMNQEAYDKTISIQKVTFYSRSKKRLWTKGEESGNFLELVSIDKRLRFRFLVGSGTSCWPYLSQGNWNLLEWRKFTELRFLK